MQDVSKEVDLEAGYKETFRVFSKDEAGCIPAEEIMSEYIPYCHQQLIDSHQVCPQASPRPDQANRGGGDD